MTRPNKNIRPTALATVKKSGLDESCSAVSATLIEPYRAACAQGGSKLVLLRGEFKN